MQNVLQWKPTLGLLMKFISNIEWHGKVKYMIKYQWKLGKMREGPKNRVKTTVWKPNSCNKVKKKIKSTVILITKWMHMYIKTIAIDIKY